jgi:hypothetical protein
MKRVEMNSNKSVSEWLAKLVNKKILYISGKNSVTIKTFDDSNLKVQRGENEVSITRNRIDDIYDALKKGAPIQVDTFFGSGGNDRSIIETVLANFPFIGFMKGNSGRNTASRKVLQLLNKEIHKIGETLDISDEQYKQYVIYGKAQSSDKSLSKPFLLLAGISGTGKTRFIQKQAEAVGSNHDNYCLTSVRPDWHEPSDLLGYVSRLGTQPEYVITDVLEFIVKAWIEIEKNGITLNDNESTGTQDQQQQVRPFWLCLDEMNLAPVEQYFADYLSVIETREWAWDNNEFVYSCKPLLKPSLFKDIEQDTLKKALGLTDHEALWQHFVKNGISIPFNFIVAGTVNMDETTHGFSRKVIDRALTFDFGEFFPNNFDEFFEPKNEPKVLGYPVWSDGRNKAALADTFDSDGSLSIALLESINTVLHNTPFKLAYRALNELLLSVMTNKPASEIELQAVWDDFMMCKVLPRVEGDIDKLTKGGEDKNIIEQLEVLLSEQFNNIWDGEIRPDLYRKSLENEKAIDIECRSKAKLKWMNDQLANGFTSFWP